MNNNFHPSKTLSQLCFCLGLISSCISYAHAQTAENSLPLEPGYTDYDKHTAVNACMEYIYLQHHTVEPATSDAFPLCEQRFLDLSRRLSHAEFVQQRQAQTDINNDYYQTLFGIAPKALSEPVAKP